MSQLRKRIMVFIVVASACVAAAVAYTVVARQRRAAERARAVSAPIPPPSEVATAQHIPERVAALPPGSIAYLRMTALDRAGEAFIASPGGANPRSLGRYCDRIHVSRTSSVCLVSDRDSGYAAANAILLDASFNERGKILLAGIPSRARVSPDGRFAAATVFVTGESYASLGRMSTRTTLIDVGRARVMFDLEHLDVRRDGQPFRAIDFNFWGVTFEPTSSDFVATLGTAGVTYLVTGKAARQPLTTARAGIECPSLSPNGSTIAFKRREPSGAFRLHVFDRATNTERPLNEPRSVDDQVEWLDDGHILYGLIESGEANIWRLPIDNSGTAERYIVGALSPAVVR